MHLNAEYKRVFHYSVDTTTIDKKIIRVRARIMKQHAVKKSALPEVQSKICPTIKISETRESSETSKSSEKKQEDSSSSREQQIIQERHTHLDRLIFNIEKEYEQDPKMVCLNPEIQGKYLISRWENTYVRVPYE